MTNGINVTGEHMAWAKDRVAELVRLRTELAHEPLVESLMSPTVMEVIQATIEDTIRFPALVFAFTMFGWVAADVGARDAGRELDLDQIDRIIEIFRGDAQA